MKFVLALSILTLFSGCISTNSNKVNIVTAFPFEKRYTQKDEITINGEKVEIPKGKTVWLLSNDTLNNLLIYSKSDEVQ